MAAKTKGTLAACACPWCKKPNDFRGLEDYGVEAGNVLSCDHCTRNFKIARVQPITMIWLEPFAGRGNLQGG